MNLEELHSLYHQPLFDLISQSRAVHLEHWTGELHRNNGLVAVIASWSAACSITIDPLVTGLGRPSIT